ncbi:MAG: hypothetical protein WB676_09575 [Bryobacteraceae bacterium]
MKALFFSTAGFLPRSRKTGWTAPFALLIASAGFLIATPAETLPPEVTGERNPGKRSEIAIDLADKALDQARSFYQSGDTARGESQLDLVGTLADECFSSAEASHKAKYFKHDEMKVSALARRVRSFMDDLGYEQRDKARRLASHLDEIHDKLLAGVMGK